MINTIQITIEGKAQTGKSAVLQSIKKMLEDHKYCVAIPERGERFNPSADIKEAKSWEKPKKDKTVIILTEITN